MPHWHYAECSNSRRFVKDFNADNNFFGRNVVEMTKKNCGVKEMQNEKYFKIFNTKL
jgi:hypothetical protein